MDHYNIQTGINIKAIQRNIDPCNIIVVSIENATGLEKNNNAIFRRGQGFIWFAL